MRANTAIKVRPDVIVKMDRTGHRYRGTVGVIREILPNDWVLVYWPKLKDRTPFNLAELEVVNG